MADPTTRDWSLRAR